MNDPQIIVVTDPATLAAWNYLTSHPAAAIAVGVVAGIFALSVLAFIATVAYRLFTLNRKFRR